MPKGYPGTGKGAKKPEEAPTGFLHHQWVAACTYVVKPEEVERFRRKAAMDTNWGSRTSGVATINGLVEVLDLYCNRCGVRSDRKEPWCPRFPMRDLPT